MNDEMSVAGFTMAIHTILSSNQYIVVLFRLLLFLNEFWNVTYIKFL